MNEHTLRRDELCLWCHQGDQPLPEVQLRKPEVTQCPICHRSIALVTIEIACRAIQVSRKTLYKWIDKGMVQRVKAANGRSRLCFSSLFCKL